MPALHWRPCCRGQASLARGLLARWHSEPTLESSTTFRWAGYLLYHVLVFSPTPPSPIAPLRPTAAQPGSHSPPSLHAGLGYCPQEVPDHWYGDTLPSRVEPANYSECCGQCYSTANCTRFAFINGTACNTCFLYIYNGTGPLPRLVPINATVLGRFFASAPLPGPPPPPSPPPSDGELWETFVVGARKLFSAALLTQQLSARKACLLLPVLQRQRPSLFCSQVACVACRSETLGLGLAPRRQLPRRATPLAASCARYRPTARSLLL